MAGGVYDVKVQGFSGATMPKFVKVKKCKVEKSNKRRKEEERKPTSLGGETVIRCRRTAFSLVRACRWSAKFVFDLIPHRANVFLRFAHLGRDHPP